MGWIDRLSRTPLLARLGLTLVASAFVVFLSTIPGHTRYEDSNFVWLVAATPVGLQKSLHVLVYATLSMLWIWTLEKMPSWWLRLAAALLLATALGAVLEWAQTMVPGRYGTLSDVLLNAFGAALGLALAVWFSRTRNANST